MSIYVIAALLIAFVLSVPLLLICLPAVLDALRGAVQRRRPDTPWLIDAKRRARQE